MIPIETNLRLESDSRLIGDNLWDWSVRVVGPPQEMAEIESVTYRLHPTFPNPVQRVVDASTGFRLRSSGWGEFAIAADVRFRDGRVNRLARWLELRDETGVRVSGSPAGGTRPTVFLSYSIADNAMVRKLSESLEGQGLEVWTDQRIEAGSDWQAELRRRMKSADFVVPVLSDPPSDFVEEEAKLARGAGRQVLPIVVGEAKLPKSLQDLVHLRLRETGNIEGLANQVVAKVKDQVIPDEDERGTLKA